MAIREENVPIVRVGRGHPELWLVAGVHGDEVEGIACVENALAQLRPRCGSLVAVPVANPPALRMGERLGPDGLDLNRVYPGTPRGTVTERIAWALWSRLSVDADALVTLHSWSRNGCVVPYAEYADSDRRGGELAAALGLPFIEPWDWPAGLLPKLAVQRGIPAVEVELGGLGRSTRSNLELGFGAIEAAAAWVGLIDEADGGRTRPLRVRRHVLAAPCQGRARHHREIGERVVPGDTAADIRHDDGAVAGALTSPVAGWVAAHETYGFVEADEPVAVVFEAIGTT